MSWCRLWASVSAAAAPPSSREPAASPRLPSRVGARSPALLRTAWLAPTDRLDAAFPSRCGSVRCAGPAANFLAVPARSCARASSSRGAGRWRWRGARGPAARHRAVARGLADRRRRRGRFARASWCTRVASHRRRAARNQHGFVDVLLGARRARRDRARRALPLGAVDARSLSSRTGARSRRAHRGPRRRRRTGRGRRHDATQDRCAVHLAAELGALAAGAPADTRAAIGRFALAMGTGLQMLDDLGSLASAARRDKGREDLRAGRPTWPWAWLAEQGPFAWSRLASMERAIAAEETDPRADDRTARDARVDELAGALAAATADTGRARVRTLLSTALAELRATVGASSALDTIAAELRRMEASYG